MSNQAKTNAKLLEEIVVLKKKIKKLEKAETAAKQADAKLRESEVRYRNIIETIQDGYFEITLNGRYTFVNDVICQHLQYSREELINIDPQLYQTPEKFEKHAKIFNKVYKTGTPVKALEMEVVRKDGTILISEVSVSLIRNAKGEPSGFHGISRDITERKKMEDTIRQSEEKYRTIIETIQDGYMEMDLAGNYVFMNDVVCEHLKYPREELIGKNYSKFLTKESAKKTFQVFSKIYKTGIPLKSFEMEGLRKDGTTGFYDLSVTLIKDEKGKPVGFRSISRDTTERKQAEEKIRHLATHDVLTDLPSLRLANDRLSQSLKMARRQKSITAVMFIDLDGFKAVNDTLGHDTGDYVLKQVAKRLLSCVRASDTVARVGGDEFLITADGIHSPENVRQIAEKVIQSVSQPIIFNGKQAVVGASIGIALCPNDGEDMNQLIKQADEAMYRIKKIGKNGFCFINDTVK